MLGEGLEKYVINMVRSARISYVSMDEYAINVAYTYV